MASARWLLSLRGDCAMHLKSKCMRLGHGDVSPSLRMRSARRILLGSPPANVAALRSTSGVAAGSRATCATLGDSLPTGSWNLASCLSVLSVLGMTTCFFPFCTCAAELVDAAPLLSTLEPAAVGLFIYVDARIYALSNLHRIGCHGCVNLKSSNYVCLEA